MTADDPNNFWNFDRPVELQVADLGRLVAHCRAFVAQQRIGCAEAIYQTDRVIENAPAFIKGVAEIVGYHREENG